MRLIFAGTPKIAAYALAELSIHHDIALVVTRNDSFVGRKRVLTPSAVAQKAIELELPILKADKITQHELAEIAQAKAELGIVVAFGSLLPQAALEEIDWWNLHFSLLPKWRGATPLQHSMMNSDGIGISVFVLERGMDTGPIILQRAMVLKQSETAGEALDRFTAVGTSMMLEALNSRPKGTPQLGEPSLAPKIVRAQARIDPHQPAAKVAAMVNALSPEPMAWAEIAGHSLLILRAQSLERGKSSSEPKIGVGEVRESDRRVLLGCAQDTHLELLEVQPAGKKAMSARDWFRGQTQLVRLD